MTIIEAEGITRILADAYLHGQELVVELTGRPVILIGLYSDVTTARYPFCDPDTDHLHRASEITIKGMKRSELL
jgi:hypothetical protein